MCIVAVHISGHTHIHRKKEEKRDLMQTKALGERTRTIINTTCGIAQRSQKLSESAKECFLFGCLVDQFLTPPNCQRRLWVAPYGIV